MIIDAHTHILPPEIAGAKASYCDLDSWFDQCYRAPKAKFASAESIIASMDQAGVDQAVVTGFAFKDQGLCRVTNDYLIASVRKYPARLIGMAAVQPLDGDRAVYEAERCLEAGLKGIGELLPDGQGFDPGNLAALRPLAGYLSATGWPLMLHSSEPVGHNYPGKGHTWPSKILQLAQNFPDLKIIAAHWGGGLPFYELMPEVQAALQNVYYDTAATTYLYNFNIFRVAVDSAGADKLLFASDFPLLKQGRLIERISAEGNLNQAELEKILGYNAAILFGWKPVEVDN